MENLTTLLQKYNKEINYLYQFKCKRSNFYGLPKTYKGKRINAAYTSSTNKQMHAANTSRGAKIETNHNWSDLWNTQMQQLLEHLPKPFLKHTQSYIRDNLEC